MSAVRIPKDLTLNVLAKCIKLFQSLPMICFLCQISQIVFLIKPLRAYGASTQHANHGMKVPIPFTRIVSLQIIHTMDNMQECLRAVLFLL